MFGYEALVYFPLLLQGFLTTCTLSSIAIVFTLILGAIAAALRISPIQGFRILATLYIEFFRNTPLLVQAFAIYFGLPKLGLLLSPFVAGTLALSLYSGAYAGEIIRSGILSIPKSQFEAARSLGFSFTQSYRLIILPQAIHITLPPLGNLLIAMIKNSAILSSIGLAELMYMGEEINSMTFRTFDVFTAIVIAYLILTLPLGWAVAKASQKIRTREGKRAL